MMEMDQAIECSYQDRTLHTLLASGQCLIIKENKPNPRKDQGPKYNR